jgi:hypothetical protein
VELPVNEGVQPLRLEHGIRESVHVAGWRLPESALLAGRQAEAQLDAQVVKELLNISCHHVPTSHGDRMTISAGPANPVKVHGQSTGLALSRAQQTGGGEDVVIFG